MTFQSFLDDGKADGPNRRRFLLGVGAGVAALSGCLGEFGDDESADDDATGADGSLPGYAAWVPATDGGVSFAYANLDGDGGPEQQEFDLQDSVADPLVTLPNEVGGGTIGVASLSLASAGLFEIVDPDTETESTAGAVLAVDESLVLTGAFDSDELHDRLTDGGEFAATYERTGELQGYDRYEPTELPEGLEEAPIVATSESAVVTTSDEDHLERVIAAERGEQARLADEADDTAWLLETAGEGDIVLGMVGPVSSDELAVSDGWIDEPPFVPAPDEDVVASLDLDLAADTLEAQFALVADELAADTETTVEDSFGTAAVDASVDIDDDQITAQGTYDAREIGELADGDREELSQDEAEALVPEAAVQYTYEPPADQSFGQFQVTVVEDVDATGIRIEAASGAHNEVTRPDGTLSAGDRIPTQVDPDGDEVTIFAVGDSDEHGEGPIGQLDTVEVPTDELTADAATAAVPDDALEFEYEPPGAGNLGSLTIEVVEDTEAAVVGARPTEAPGSFGDTVGSIGAEMPVEAGTTLQTAVDPDGDEIIVFATVDGATGDVTRWEGPDE